MKLRIMAAAVCLCALAGMSSVMAMEEKLQEELYNAIRSKNIEQIKKAAHDARAVINKPYKHDFPPLVNAWDTFSTPEDYRKLPAALDVLVDNGADAGQLRDFFMIAVGNGEPVVVRWFMKHHFEDKSLRGAALRNEEFYRNTSPQFSRQYAEIAEILK